MMTLKFSGKRKLIPRASSVSIQAAPLVFLLLLISMQVTFPAPAGAAAAPAVKPAGAYAIVSAQQLRIGNSYIERVIGISKNRAATLSITNRTSGAALPSAEEEFAFSLMDGTRISSADFEFMRASAGKELNGGKTLTAEYTNSNMNIKARVVYSVSSKEPLISKKVLLSNAGKEPVSIDSITVDHFYGVKDAEIGGMGQPVYMGGSFFTGLEHPAGYNNIEPGGEVTLTHYPGWTLGSAFMESKTAVIGATPKGNAAAGFMKYVESIRRKPRPILVYNSWFDLRGDDLDSANLKKSFDAYKKNLAPYGVNLDSFVIDDGWQQMGALWTPVAKKYPGGFQGLSDYFRKNGSALGLWMPLCGYGLAASLMAGQGLEISPNGGYFCLAGENYRAALKKRVDEFITKDRVNYFKHDFNFLDCTGKKPGCKPTEKQSFEANVDGEIDMLDYMHSLNPDVFLNVTSYMWLSPWWMPHADCLWIGSSDYGDARSAPSIRRRDRTTTYFDEYIYRRLRIENAQYPAYAVMTHGLIDGKLNRLGGEDEDTPSWSDAAMMYIGRGVLMRELYLTPEVVSGERWALLGQMLKWAETKTDIFTTGVLLGGNPAKGEAYWYQFDDGKSDLVTLRNPSFMMQKASLTLKHPKNLVRVIYPYRQWLPASAVNARGGLDIELLENEILVLESVPRETLKRPVVTGARSRVVRQTDTETEYELSSPDGVFTFPVVSGVKTSGVFLDGLELKPLKDGIYKAAVKKARDIAANAGATENAGETSLDFDLRSEIPAGSKDLKLVVIARNAGKGAPNIIKYNDAPVASSVSGIGWNAFVFPVKPGSQKMKLSLDSDALSSVPFLNSDSVNLYAAYTGSLDGITARLVIKHAPAPKLNETLPPAPMQNTFRIMNPVIDRDFNVAKYIRERTFTGSMKDRIKAAKVHIRVFGSPSSELPDSITINGMPVGSMPRTSFPHDSWEEFDMDVPVSGLKAIKAVNKIVITNLSGKAGSPFKFTDIAVAVQLDDGSWISSNYSSDIQYSGKGWKDAEGEYFDASSKPVKVSFSKSL